LDTIFGFLDQLKLSIGWSDNAALGACVADLGRQYLNRHCSAAGNLVDRHLHAGRMYRLLEDYPSQAVPVHIGCPSRQSLALRTRDRQR
jgi:hypothetical protein